MNTRLTTRAVVAGLILLVAAAPAPAQPEAAAAVSLSAVSNPGKRAKWQERLTLGPGDRLNITLLETPNSSRNDVLVGPDGRINYMEAQDFPVTGLTVDELRAALDKELGKYYLAPRTIVIPVAYQSKKFFMLGAVRAKGVFTLDRPTSIIEAVARAGGLEAGVIGNNPMDLADLTHSFMVRDGKHLAVDFEKLFQRGDLSQNIPLEPNDFLFFQPAGLNEIYVLGQVNSPGSLPWDPAATVISAITRRGSFSPVAYRQKVLVVRGSLQNPETFVVNMAAVLKGEQLDFKLQPKDIVYVAVKPWQAAQDLLQSAMAAFVTASIVTYAGENIGPFIETPIIK